MTKYICQGKCGKAKDKAEFHWKSENKHRSRVCASCVNERQKKSAESGVQFSLKDQKRIDAESETKAFNLLNRAW